MTDQPTRARPGVLAEFDRQMRRDPAAGPGSRVEREERVTRVISGEDGWSGVLWTDLAEADADAMIDAQVRRFAALGRPWEWKYYSYDQPAGLPAKLRAAGFVPDPAETLLVAEIADLNLDPSPPAGVDLVPVTDAHGVAQVARVHDEVFGGDHTAIASAILAALDSRPRPVEAVVAVAGNTAVSAARVEFPEHGDFASLWGGGTLPGWRGRGVFRSMVAYRARLASERGYRYLQVDASAASRPILVRLGFTELATTTPFRHPGHLSGPQPVAPGVVRRGTKGYDEGMAHPGEPATDVSVRQFVADSGAVTRGLRQGRTYTLTLNGEPLAKMIPIRRRRAVPKEEVLAIFATAPAIDAEELRADLDEAVSQELRDPYEGTGL